MSDTSENNLESKPKKPEEKLQSVDQLIAEAEQLGLVISPKTPRANIETKLSDRIALVKNLDRGALLDLALFSSVKVDDNPSNEILVARVLRCHLDNFDALSDRGLHALAKLKGLIVSPGVSRSDIIRLLRKKESFRETVRRHRRKLMGSVLSRMFEPEISNRTSATETGTAELKKRIQKEGVVSGISKTIRGAADDYVAEKLDEIESRIDAKLDEIDFRLAQWRDREMANRLKILKITLIFSILVALVSLGYDYLRKGQTLPPPSATEVRQVDNS